MTFPLPTGGSEVGGPPGYSYAALVLALETAPGRSCSRADVLAELRALRFTGWLAQPEEGWLVAVPADPRTAVAAGRRGLLDVGLRLAERFGTTVLAFRVLTDRQLVIAAWTDGTELGRYVSAPAHDHPDAAEILDEPIGAEHAAAFAAACGRPEAAEKLADLLGSELPDDSVNESERLAEVLHLLRLPEWLVAASSLPRDVPTGPARSEFTRLGGGAEGVRGLLRRFATDRLRRRRTQPPVAGDPPRQRNDIDPWLL